MKLLGEEIDSKVAVLAGLGGCGNADDLARAALQDQKVTNADMVARNGDGIGPSTTFDIADSLTDAITDTGRATLTILFLDHDLLSFMVRVERMEDAICGFLNTVTE